MAGHFHGFDGHGSGKVQPDAFGLVGGFGFQLQRGEPPRFDLLLEERLEAVQQGAVLQDGCPLQSRRVALLEAEGVLSPEVGGGEGKREDEEQTGLHGVVG